MQDNTRDAFQVQEEKKGGEQVVLTIEEDIKEDPRWIWAWSWPQIWWRRW
jgi:hypothetical protein